MTLCDTNYAPRRRGRHPPWSGHYLDFFFLSHLGPAAAAPTPLRVAMSVESISEGTGRAQARPGRFFSALCASCRGQKARPGTPRIIFGSVKELSSFWYVNS